MRPHPIRNIDYQKLRRKLNIIANHIGAKLDRNHTFDERGLTDELLDLLLVSFKHVKIGSNYLKISAHKPSEKNTGADILLRVIVSKSDLSFDRYVLLQAKKYLKIKDKFSETEFGNSHLTNQILKLHKYNPEFSYILLYSTNFNPISNFILENNNTFAIPTWDFSCEIEDLIYFDVLESSINIQRSYPLTLLRTKTWEKMINTSSENLLNYSETLPNFLLDDLITGKIGKEWDTYIESVKGEFSVILNINIGQG